jgi:hypothetical protein
VAQILAPVIEEWMVQRVPHAADLGVVDSHSRGEALEAVKVSRVGLRSHPSR